MPATSNATANMVRRQAFNGKGLTFVEMIFDADMLTTATTPDTKDSVFHVARDTILEHGTLLAASYSLGLKATEQDAADGASITEDELIDVYQFIMEGTPGQLNASDSAGDINLDPDQAATTDASSVIAGAEADVEVDLLARISENDSAGGVNVNIRYLPADGVTSAGEEILFGTFNARVNS
jgi:hypothetical protein